MIITNNYVSVVGSLFLPSCNITMATVPRRGHAQIHLLVYENTFVTRVVLFWRFSAGDEDVCEVVVMLWGMRCCPPVSWWWMGPSHTWGSSGPLSFTELHKHVWQSSCSVSDGRIQGEAAWPQNEKVCRYVSELTDTHEDWKGPGRWEWVWSGSSTGPWSCWMCFLKAYLTWLLAISSRWTKENVDSNAVVSCSQTIS